MSQMPRLPPAAWGPSLTRAGALTSPRGLSCPWSQTCGLSRASARRLLFSRRWSFLSFPASSSPGAHSRSAPPAPWGPQAQLPAAALPSPGVPKLCLRDEVGARAQ